jgi:hypothetical protein
MTAPLNTALLTTARLERTAALKLSAELLLRQDFKDAPHWRRLAAEHGVHFPAWYVPGSDARPIRRAARALGITPDELAETFGVRSVVELAKYNPSYPAWAVIGLLLELVAERAAPVSLNQ